MIILQINPEVLTQLVVAGPAAAAVIVTVVVFLNHQKAERTSRDAMLRTFMEAVRTERSSRDNAQKEFAETIGKLSIPIQELTIEVRMLRDRHYQAAGGNVGGP